DKVDEEISLKLDKLKRSFIVAEVLDSGMIVLVDDIDQAVELVNLYAPEHHLNEEIYFFLPIR
ncbi:unnamed protein product, partial [marine sediment metagenome]